MELQEPLVASHAESARQSPSQSAVPTRRSFLGALLGLGTAAIGALLSVPLLRFALHPLLVKTTGAAWAEVGAAAEFAALTAPVKRLVKVEQLDGWRKVVSEKSVYVVKGKDGQARVLSAVCPHLGCSVPWNENKGQFICQCHVGVFAADGALVSGPPPRGMDELETRVEGGQLQVRYQYFRQLVPTKEVIG